MMHEVICEVRMGGAWESGPPKTNPVPNPPAFNQIGGYEQLERGWGPSWLLGFLVVSGPALRVGWDPLAATCPGL